MITNKIVAKIMLNGKKSPLLLLLGFFVFALGFFALLLFFFGLLAGFLYLCFGFLCPFFFGCSEKRKCFLLRFSLVVELESV